jgi:hypothetical protein
MIPRLTRIALFVTAAVALTLGGCALDKTSIEDRIAEFIADANAGDYSNLYKHLHSDCSQRNAAKAPAFWDTTAFGPSQTPVSLSGMSYGTTSTGTINCAGAGAQSITFQMKEEESDDWFILSISVTTFGVIN